MKPLLYRRMLLLSILLVSCLYAKDDKMAVFKTERIGGRYDYKGIKTDKFSITDQQFRYHKNLGYTHVLYDMHAFTDYYFAFDETENIWHYNNRFLEGTPLQDKGINYCGGAAKDLRGVLKHAKENGISVIPVIRNPISHNERLVAALPEMSAVPCLDDFLYIQTDHSDYMKPNLILEVKNTSTVKVRYYVLVDSRVSDSEISFLSHRELDTVFRKVETMELSPQALGGLGDTVDYKIYRSIKPYGQDEVVEIWNDQSTFRSKNMFSVLICPDGVDLYSKEPAPKLEADLFELTAYTYSSFSAVNGLTKDEIGLEADYNVFDFTGEGTKLYNNADDEVIVSPFHDIRGALGFMTHLQYLKNSESKEIRWGNRIHNPVKYNPIVKPMWNTSSTNEDDRKQAKINNSLFEEHLKLLRTVYNNCSGKPCASPTDFYTQHPESSGRPEFILIGYDEIGLDGFNMLKKHYGVSDNELAKIIADELKYRIKQIDDVFPTLTGPPVKVLVWGDSFVPNDYGELYGFCGDVESGEGGVLKYLDEYGLKDRIIVCPWRYNKKSDDLLMGDYSPIVLDKMSQIRYLNNLGYKYMPMLGEEKGIAFQENVESGGDRKITEQCSFEWLNAGQAYKDNLAGYVHTLWHPWDSLVDDPLKDKDNILHADNNLTEYSYLAPLIPYTLEYPELITRYSTDITSQKFIQYNPMIFSGIKWLKSEAVHNVNKDGTLGDPKPGLFDNHATTKSREDLAWQKGIHYRTGFALAELTSFGMETQDDGSSSAKWDTDLLTFSIEGSSGDLWATEESGLFAFITRDDNFDFQVKVHDMGAGGKAGILIREHEGKDANLIHLHYNDEDKNITVHVRDGSNNGHVYQFPKLIASADIANGVILKARRVNTTIQLFASKSNDGNLTKLAEVPFSSENVFVGMLSAKSTSNNVTFSDISLEKYVDMTPINMLLLD